MRRVKGDERFGATCPPAASESPWALRRTKKSKVERPTSRKFGRDMGHAVFFLFAVLSHADDQFSSRMLLLQISERIGYLAQ